MSKIVFGVSRFQGFWHTGMVEIMVFDHLPERLVGWLAGWLVGWLAGWLPGRLLAGGLVG